MFNLWSVMSTDIRFRMSNGKLEMDMLFEQRKNLNEHEEDNNSVFYNNIDDKPYSYVIKHTTRANRVRLLRLR